MPKRILFISHYFEPYPGVGAMRVSYWARNIHRYGMEAHVVTAFPGDQNNYRRIYIPLRSQTRVMRWLVKDPGLAWKKELLRYFNSELAASEYDYILITGGPFLHMGIAARLKQRFRARVILDFRDPFAVNPRFSEPVYKRLLKQRLEKRFVRHADLVITVNEHCANLIHAAEKRLALIQNGYDEDQVALCQQRPSSDSPQGATNGIRIVHAGKFDEGRNPQNLIRVIEASQLDVSFHHFGWQPNHLPFLKDQRRCHDHGEVPYDEVLRNISAADACVLFTSGHPFESTTKLFDYIAFNRKILVVTEGRPCTGSIHEITRNYPNVVWSRNVTGELEKAIQKLLALKLQRFDPTPFSRRVSLEKLVAAMEQI